jgi:hypothetical protein
MDNSKYIQDLKEKRAKAQAEILARKAKLNPPRVKETADVPEDKVFEDNSRPEVTKDYVDIKDTTGLTSWDRKRLRDKDMGVSGPDDSEDEDNSKEIDVTESKTYNRVITNDIVTSGMSLPSISSIVGLVIGVGVLLYVGSMVLGIIDGVASEMINSSSSSTVQLSNQISSTMGSTYPIFWVTGGVMILFIIFNMISRNNDL